MNTRIVEHTNVSACSKDKANSKKEAGGCEYYVPHDAHASISYKLASSRRISPSFVGRLDSQLCF